MQYRKFIPLALCCAAPITASAQSLPSLPGMGVPNLSSLGVPNAAGVIEYCLKNKFLSGGSASSVLGSLMKTPNVKSNPNYTQGTRGNIVTGSGSPFALSSVPKQLQTQACDAVLKQGSKLI